MTTWTHIHWRDGKARLQLERMTPAVVGHSRVATNGGTLSPETMFDSCTGVHERAWARSSRRIDTNLLFAKVRSETSGVH